jgi:hypothetical protein
MTSIKPPKSFTKKRYKALLARAEQNDVEAMLNLANPFFCEELFIKYPLDRPTQKERAKIKELQIKWLTKATELGSGKAKTALDSLLAEKMIAKEDLINGK